ncbi:isocitrate lyase/PEP mutase family protein, partial [bacterium]|nr:isocitrate lyase/PEP mutase family protein [bacterium]
MEQAKRLRSLLERQGPIVAAGAHSGLSARLVEQAGFDAIWASGFEISAARGVPDANVLTQTETLAAAREMADATQIPVIADCDNGFGNAINVIRTVRDYEAAG